MVVGAAIALTLTASFFTAASRAVGDNRFLVPWTTCVATSPTAPIRCTAASTSAHRYMNQHTPPGHKVLLVGDAQPFDIEPPAVYATCFDQCPFERLLKGRTRQERLDALRRERIAYVFVYWHEIDRYRDTYGFSDYVTKDIVRIELVEQQKLLRKVPLFVGHRPRAKRNRCRPTPANCSRSSTDKERIMTRLNRRGDTTGLSGTGNAFTLILFGQASDVPGAVTRAACPG